MAKKTNGTIGILTAGGDCPGLNAVIRGVAKAALHYGIRVIGIRDGFRGLIENRTLPLDSQAVSGILTQGGTFLGSSRDKPHKMPVGGKVVDMTNVAVRNYKKLKLDCLVCLGGNGTQKTAFRLHQRGGLNVLTLPKTIDNDVAETDITFGFDSAMAIATEAIDRLHTTATSHQRIIVVEIMGHDAGWLCLGAGIAGGADVILIPEIPYDLEAVARHLTRRRKAGKRFSLIAVAEGIISREEAKAREAAKRIESPFIAESGGTRLVQEPVASRLARQLQQLTGVEARVTSLGHVQRGGTPTPFDRLLCTRLGTKAGELLAQGRYNIMVGVRGTECVPVPLAKVAGIKRVVPTNHPWIKTARLVETCLGDDCE
ncbi:ATP-dependent 6-phosphofructokinase [Opitutus sp. ER46]|uniref:6-phosphofructokinase n=1 Tax=Opitutus sp. ER46 TaxID=2161864 RepID=UPI000D30D18E|nr:ATP-dependent 6-phosphofructokinase [Opitutus sp. ER46]PTX94264.1 6-phosphofructokinase [Opitutus sp. ER46]